MGRPPKDELEDACARWGWNGAAEEYGVDRATIVRWLRESDMTKAARKGDTTTIYDHAEIVRLYVDDVLSCAEVANRVGCDRSLVGHVIRARGIGRPAGETPHARVDALVARVDAGEMVRAVAREAGMDETGLAHACRRRGVYCNVPRDERRRELVDAIERGWSDEDISEEYEVTLATAARWRRRLERAS